MRTRKLASLTISCLAAVTVAACSSPTSGAPAPTSSAPVSSQQTSALPHHGAPAVAGALNATAVTTDPCTAVTSSQVEQAGGKVSSSRVDQLSAGKFCTFAFEDGLSTVSAGVDTLDKDGLSHLYALKAQNSGITTFEPQKPVLGYPAVKFANGGEDSTECQLAVGISNETMYMVFSRLGSQSPYASNPCDLSAKVAEFAIQHLKGS